MIVGAGIYQLPAIIAAKKMGLKVVAIDKNPSLEGMRLSDVPGEISTTDIENALILAKKNKIKGILTIGSDVSLPTVSIIAQKLGLKGLPLETIKASSVNKDKMLHKLSLAGLPVVTHRKFKRFKDCLNFAAKDKFPLILKPIDGWGSRGLSRVDSKKELKDAFDNAMSYSAKKEICAEEYVEGKDTTCEAFILKKRLVFSAFTEKRLTDPPYYAPVSHIMPLRIGRTRESELKGIVEKAADVMDIDEGPMDVDIRLTLSGPRIIELAARLGGNCVPQLVKESFGFDIIEAAINLSLGRRPKIKKTKKDFSGVSILGSKKAGYVKDIRGIEQARRIRGISEIYIDVKPGDSVNTFKTGSDRIGHIIARATTKERVKKNISHALNLLKIKIEK